MSLDYQSGSSAVVTHGAPDASAARAFYRDAMRGAEVWPTGTTGCRRALSFMVAGTLVDVRLDGAGAPGPVELHVEDPEGLAARCWDAGYAVYVREDGARGRHLAVVDPFGRRVDLLDRPTRGCPQRTAGEEQK